MYEDLFSMDPPPKKEVYWSTFLLDHRWNDVYRKGLGKIQKSTTCKAPLK